MFRSTEVSDTGLRLHLKGYQAWVLPFTGDADQECHPRAESSGAVALEVPSKQKVIQSLAGEGEGCWSVDAVFQYLSCVCGQQTDGQVPAPRPHQLSGATLAGCLSSPSPSVFM